MDGWNLVRDWEDPLFREVFELTDSQRMIEYFSQPGWTRPFSASGKFYVLRKRMYARSRFTATVTIDVCIYGGSREEIEIVVQETSRSLALNFSP